MPDTKNTPATEIATEVENVILKGLEDCSKIICISSDNAYGKGKRHEQGKTYSQFRLGNIVFTVGTDSPFVADQKAGIVTKVELRKTLVPKKTIDDSGNEVINEVPGLEFDYHLSTNQTNAFKDQLLVDEEHEMKLELLRLKQTAFKSIASKPITEDFLTQLLSNS
jgi:hypothetical protein